MHIFRLALLLPSFGGWARNFKQLSQGIEATCAVLTTAFGMGLFSYRLHGQILLCSSKPHRAGRGFPKGRESPLGHHDMVWVPRGKNALQCHWRMVDGVEGRAKSP